MRTSQLYFPTLKETPVDASVVSQQLMLRAGMIHRVAAGIYSWLPLGLRVLRKVESIVREEMNHIGAQELLLPIVQPAELWQETGRWEMFGPELFTLQDRHQHSFCLGPTHEEIITDLLRHKLHSYKQLPVVFYQIQTKFRDEIRPRFGIMRAREFLMKDAYSFHLTKASLADTYRQMHQAYGRILTRLGLNFRVVLADTGNIGGNTSQEFQVLANAGEDQIFYSDQSDYAANRELASCLVTQTRPAPTAAMEKIHTPGMETIAAVSTYLNIAPWKILKTILVQGKAQPIVALLLRGDHELNLFKAARLPQVAQPLCLVSPEAIEQWIGPTSGYLGPIGLSVPMLVDRDAAVLADFVCGANQKGYHWRFVNWERDLPLPEVADLRDIVVGDTSPDGCGHLQSARGIEVGHIFQLGNRYSQAMNAYSITEGGVRVPVEMGCYGIGISRIVAAAIEQHHDEHGIIWPMAIAPFQVVVIPIGYYRSKQVRDISDSLYQQLTAAGLEVLLDDRDTRTGVAFADMELIGIPHRLVVSDKSLSDQQVEYRSRCDAQLCTLDLDRVVDFMLSF